MAEIELLYGIKELNVTWLKSRPPILRIFGFGVARTGGWSKAVLPRNASARQAHVFRQPQIGEG
jgi:hypothetical protein